MNVLRDFLNDEQGADGIEYGLLAALIFLVIVVAVSAVASKTVAMWNDISSHVN